MSLGGTELVCPTCERTFPDGTAQCPFDAAPLTTVTAPLDPLIGTTIDGKFTIQSRIGVGGMGVVYAAQQRSLERMVALKVLSTKLSADRLGDQRFRTEARAASQLRNPHAVTIHDFGVSPEGLHYIAMEYLEGESLRARLKGGPLGTREAVSIASQVADALSEAHAREPQIIHRDVKPDNVMLRTTRDGEPFATVVDFGLALLANDQRLTANNMIVGTVAYMAPEQAIGGGAMDDRLDVYALGASLFEMLAGVTPFTSPNNVALLHKHVYDAPPSLLSTVPDVPAELDALVLEMLAKAPDERPSALQVRARLLALLDQIPRSASTVSLPPARDPGAKPTSGPTRPRSNPTPPSPMSTRPRSNPTPPSPMPTTAWDPNQPPVVESAAGGMTPSDARLVSEIVRTAAARTKRVTAFAVAIVLVASIAGIAGVRWAFTSTNAPGSVPPRPPVAAGEPLAPAIPAVPPAVAETPKDSLPPVDRLPSPGSALHSGASPSPRGQTPRVRAGGETAPPGGAASGKTTSTARASSGKPRKTGAAVDSESVDDDILNELNGKQ